jgi:hypothetical protein
MSKTNKFAIIVSFFALWINVTFSPNYQQVIGFVVIFLFGILHGANDLALFQKISATKKSISLQKLTLYYIRNSNFWSFTLLLHPNCCSTSFFIL